MKRRIHRRQAIHAVAATAGLTALSRLLASAAEPQDPKGAAGKRAQARIPASLKAEHDELHQELVRATEAGGKTGEAAHTVAKVLDPHFAKEEELAMPPLSLLPALAARTVRPEMAGILETTDRLEKELPSMLKEHGEIVVALDALGAAAKEENKPQARQLADKLKQHARSEEEVLYPAAVLVGAYVRLKLNR
ncbi:MAG TPA: hemerythrin domain-containing protein [Armatimonadaceae bacterium]|nr:hemerythrin domain-containing protein [Armatimonadaceae bacterium]